MEGNRKRERVRESVIAVVSLSVSACTDGTTAICRSKTLARFGQCISAASISVHAFLMDFSGDGGGGGQWALTTTHYYWPLLISIAVY